MNRLTYAKSGAKGLFLAGVAAVAMMGAMPMLATQASAQGPQVLDNATADDVANVLFAKPGTSKGKTRALVFDDEPAAKPAAAQPAPQPAAHSQPAPAPAPQREQLRPMAAAEPAPQRPRPQPAPQPAYATPAPAATAGNVLAMKVEFGINSTDVMGHSRGNLDAVGQAMSRPEAQGKTLVIEGHTDASGDYGYNQRLSQMRAEAVKQYLVYFHRVNPNQLVTIGKGEAEPLPGINPYDGVNRRVQFYIQ